MSEALPAGEWKQLRERVLRRDDHECQFCGVSDEAHREQFRQGIEVHHIIPRKIGGRDLPHNLITVCSSCHATLEKVHGRAMVEMDRRERGEPATGTSVIGKDGQTRVPRSIRRELGLVDGDRLHWQYEGGDVIHIWVEDGDR